MFLPSTFFPLYGFLVVILASVYSSFFFAACCGASLFFKERKPLFSSLAARPLGPAGETALFGLLGHTGGLGTARQVIALSCKTRPLRLLGPPFLMVFPGYYLLAWQKGKTHPASALFLLLFPVRNASAPLFPEAEREEPLRLALFQGNIPQEEILDQTLANRNFQRYLDLSEKAVLQDSPLDLMVWPETVLSNGVIKNNPAVKDQLAGLAQKTGAAIFFGPCMKRTQQETCTIPFFFRPPARHPGKLPVMIKCALFHGRVFFLSAFINEFLKLNVSLGIYPRSQNSCLSLKGSTLGE